MKLPRIVLFGLIGTLTYPWRHPSAEERFELIANLQREGIRVGPQEFDAAFNFSLHIDSPQKRFTSSRELLVDVIRLLGESASKEVLAILDKDLKNRLPTLRPYAKAVLDELRAYGIMSVVTTDLPAFLALQFRDELSGYIDRWFSSTDIGLPKGHPDFLPRIFQALRIDEPTHVLVVGNNELLDFHIPRIAGAQALHSGDSELTPAISTIEELPKFIKGLISA
jgi:FMN phosphatase YigB (HAD superfamily)